ncbi:tripartite tricarboxylate transporter substrate-binding protein [Bradyrhizobium liaoningense]
MLSARLLLVFVIILGGALWATEPRNDNSDYPARRITLIVPWTPGGPRDVLSRVIASHMSLILRQEVVVENIVGVGGLTASLRAKQAAPDGYTLLMGNTGTHAAAPALYPNLAYDPQIDFEPIGLVTTAPIVILGRRDFPAADLNGFVNYVEANSPKLDEGHAGVGSISFIACARLNHLLRATPRLVPYEGTVPLMDAVARGRIDYMCDTAINAAPQIHAGRVRAYGIAATSRSMTLPNVPTTKEGGLSEYELSVWYAMFVPKGVSSIVVEKLNDALSRTLDDKAVRDRLVELGGNVPDHKRRGPEALAELVRDEVNRWAAFIKSERLNVN